MHVFPRVAACWPRRRCRGIRQILAFSSALAVTAWGGSSPEQPRELSWDDREKAVFSREGDTEARAEFSVTNNTSDDVVIYRIHPSCGCTTLEMPPTPWLLEPGTSGVVRARVDLKGKYGKVEKTLQVDSSLGREVLLLRLFLPAKPASDLRERNRLAGQADRQAVFRGDCARCHVPPPTAVDSAAIYKTACAICHEAPNRAAMIPNLAVGHEGRDAAFWEKWIREGRVDSLMPAFSKQNGGVLSDEKIRELVIYLQGRFEPSVPNTSKHNSTPPASPSRP